MITKELVEFIKKSLASGETRSNIVIKLKKQGWNDKDLIEAFDEISNVPQLDQSPGVALNQDISSLETVNEMASDVKGIPQSSFEPVYSHRSRKVLKIFIFVFILLIITAAVAYGSGYFISASKLFSQTLDSSKKNTSVSYNFQMTLDATNMKLPEGVVGVGLGDVKTFNFIAKGATDFSDEKNIKLNNKIYFKTGKIEVEIDSRAINNSFYLSLTKAPDLGFFSLAPFENKWIVFKENSDSESKDLKNNPLFTLAPIDTNLVTDITEEQKQKITEIFNNASLIKITKKHLPQMVDGSLSYHFDFNLDKEGIALFLKEMANYIESQDKNKDEIIVGESIDYNEYTNKMLSSVNNFQGEAWVGIFDKLPHKIIINLDIVNPEESEDGSAHIILNMVYTDWNKPVEVIVPANAVPIQELISEVMGSMFGKNSSISEIEFQPTSISDPLGLETARTKGKDANIKSIMANMRAQAELYFDANEYTYKGFCTSKSDLGAYNLTVNLPNNSHYKCNEDYKNGWSAWVEISSGEKYCVDSTGYSGLLKNTETAASCF